MKLIHEYLLNNTKFNTLLNPSQKKYRGINDNASFSVVSILYELSKKSVLLVLPNLFEASKFYDLFLTILPSDVILFYPCDELITAELFVSSNEFKVERMHTIYNLINNPSKKKYLVITSHTGLIKKQFSINHYKAGNIKLTAQNEYSFSKIAKKIAYLGYKKCFQVEKPGDYSLRGSIIDFFPLNQEYPIRLDFFGDYLEQIKQFKVSNQMSFNNLKEFDIFPFSEMFFNEEMYESGIKKIETFIEKENLSTEEKARFNNDLENIKNFEKMDLMNRYIEFFSSDLINISDFDFEKRIIIDLDKFQQIENKLIEDLKIFCESINGYALLKFNYFYFLKHFNFEDYYQFEGLVTKNSEYFNLNCRTTLNYITNFNQFIKDLESYHNYKTVILFFSEKRITGLKTILEEKAIFPRINKIEKNKINILTQTYASFEMTDDNIVLISEQDVYKNYDFKKKIRYKSSKYEGEKVSDINELKQGDYIVHYDHGIGRYLGIVTLELSGKLRDYLHIQYAKEDKLYIPIEQLDLISKYSKSETHNPSLSDLSTNTWQKTKEKVKKRLLDISEKLIELYAERQNSVGFQCHEKHSFEYELESDFEFQETPDQLIAMENITKDMESIKPMDRLLCADVGYGKTELALRAAFKMILNNKQVVYLAPTTILTKQHYNTFKNRLEKFGARVELLNRFVSTKDQKQILHDIKLGSVDCVIGTHRVLSHDLVFKDLGLLIIDEEQRFGVLHKERIKEIKVNVDTLTLSATPIPRTLQMSLLGIKDLSIINTPPQNRYPIQTYVVERHNSLIKEAIEKELARKGQIFYLYNKVEDIESIEVLINSLVPQARIAIAHGKLSKNQLENVIDDFINYEYDVLLCTTIIETGIDIPNTNTLIIHDADRLGLSQLYQIRGRVGRSDRIGYAYLMFDRSKIINDVARKRLEAIKEFTELGSGLKIAMRDLDIRGAGDILGSEQSGFIDSVGIDLYMKLLEEAINIKKNIFTPKPEQAQEIGEVLSNRTINNNYINNDDLKIEIHRKITNIKSSKDVTILKNELEDRFGKLSEELEFYMQEKLFKYLTYKVGVDSIENNNLIIKIIFSSKKSATLNAERLFYRASKISNLFRFNYQTKKISISLDKSLAKQNWILWMNQFLEDMLEEEQNEKSS